MTRHWLVKTEPDSYSIDDLRRDGKTFWHGVRNYQARNFMRDEMRVGDAVLFYHSGANPPGIVGLARVAREGYPDPTALDPESDYFDPKASTDDPRWYMVDIEFVEKFPEILPLGTLRDIPDLVKMPLVNKSRLSVQPVTPEEYQVIVALGRSGGGSP